MKPEAIELLQRVKAAVLANPDHFDMDFWYALNLEIEPNETGLYEVDAHHSVPDVPLLGLLDRCGTVACAAGWIVALAGESVKPGEPIVWEAERLIDFNDSVGDACPLFGVARWPKDLQTWYYNVARVEERSHALAAAIDRWIALDGDPYAFSAS